jgi:alkanesulfonate monooxygenase SsuD/methylene tetrahydromethanopterin reductase-like flavin-dependent oxidoreductase (luciferase family)
MKFGVFDHLDRSGAPLAEQYEDRLQLIETYEAAGFHAYHLAEHHSTPLGMAPSPAVFLSAVAQRTRRLRFGPLVYPLPLYHPLRIAEEICMLDHLSGGRLDIGFGRGASQFEIEFYGIDPSEAQARYEEAREIVLMALQRDSVTYAGRFQTFDNSPVVMRPFQQPHPRLFYGAGHPETGAKAARERNHLVCNAPVAIVKPIFERFREEWASVARPDEPMPLLGVNRHCVIAPTDAVAQELAERAYKIWHASFFRLWVQRNSKPNNAAYPETFAGLQAMGYGIAGSPQTVRDFYMREIGDVGANYALGRFAFGDITLAEARRSVELFRDHVMPALSRLEVTA